MFPGSDLWVVDHDLSEVWKLRTSSAFRMLECRTSCSISAPRVSCRPPATYRPGDVLLARHGEKEGRRYGLRQRIEKGEGGALACRMLPWDTGDDVHAAFERELEGVRETSRVPKTSGV